MDEKKKGLSLETGLSGMLGVPWAVSIWICGAVVYDNQWHSQELREALNPLMWIVMAGIPLIFAGMLSILADKEIASEEKMAFYVFPAMVICGVTGLLFHLLSNRIMLALILLLVALNGFVYLLFRFIALKLGIELDGAKGFIIAIGTVALLSVAMSII